MLHTITPTSLAATMMILRLTNDSIKLVWALANTYVCMLIINWLTDEFIRHANDWRWHVDNLFNHEQFVGCWIAMKTTSRRRTFGVARWGEDVSRAMRDLRRRRMLLSRARANERTNDSTQKSGEWEGKSLLGVFI